MSKKFTHPNTKLLREQIAQLEEGIDKLRVQNLRLAQALKTIVEMPGDGKIRGIAQHALRYAEEAE